ncbi:MAG: hypothetical protein WCA85_10115 [Paraburkholderia sp.]|uniref:hypothetical protein n=1 Tax=Paraburkholderia sp. TaxID=1926495 RepID=UPI003C535660
MILPQLPGMQVMHALVGCQKRWINSLTRRFHSLDMINALVAADATICFVGSVSGPFNPIAALVMDVLTPSYGFASGHSRILQANPVGVRTS